MAPFTISPEEADSGLDPAAVTRRRRIAEMLMGQGMQQRPIQHWTQGAAKIAQALTGGFMAGKTDRDEKGERDKARADELSFFSDAFSTGASSAQGDPAPPSKAGFAPIPQKPTGASARVAQAFDALTPATPNERVQTAFNAVEGTKRQPIPDADLDMIVRTVFGEAGGEDPTGQQAVAAVIANRAKQAGMTPSQVVMAPNQFEPWGNPETRARLEALTPDSPAYKAILETIKPVLAGEAEDPTGGATHFYAPKAQSALGRPAPKWDDGKGVDIGNHRFFRHGYSGQGEHGIPASAAAPSAPAAAGNTTPNAERIMRILSNPYSSKGGQTVAAALAQKMFTPEEYGFQEINGSLYRTNPRRGTAEVAVKGAPKYEKVGKNDVLIDPVTREEVFRNTPKGAPGQVLDEDTRKAANELRDEFNTNGVKPYVAAREGYQKVLAAAKDESAAGDIALIFGYMKTLDPTSTVREGEFATAQNAGGLSDQVRNMYNRVASGERLNVEQRKMFSQSALGQFKVAEKNFAGEAMRYKGLAGKYGIPEDLVLRTFDDVEEPAAPRPKPGQPAQPKTQQDFDRLKPGDLYIDPDDGKPYRKQ